MQNVNAFAQKEAHYHKLVYGERVYAKWARIPYIVHYM